MPTSSAYRRGDADITVTDEQFPFKDEAVRGKQPPDFPAMRQMHIHHVINTNSRVFPVVNKAILRLLVNTYYQVFVIAIYGQNEGIESFSLELSIPSPPF